MYSALKRDGKPLDEYARQGIELDRPARKVTIYKLELLSLDGLEAEIAVQCSKGTYIRTLAQDIGRQLGCEYMYPRSEEHTSELQSPMRISYAVLSLNKKIHNAYYYHSIHQHTHQHP